MSRKLFDIPSFALVKLARFKLNPPKLSRWDRFLMFLGFKRFDIFDL